MSEMPGLLKARQVLDELSTEERWQLLGGWLEAANLALVTREATAPFEVWLGELLRLREGRPDDRIEMRVNHADVKLGDLRRLSAALKQGARDE